MLSSLLRASLKSNDTTLSKTAFYLRQILHRYLILLTGTGGPFSATEQAIFWISIRKYQFFFGVWSLVPFIKRLLTLPAKKSILLLGPRNTGKSTLLTHQYPAATSITLDLLDSVEEAQFARDPNRLYSIVTALPDAITHVIIDEIQKVPRLLDSVQRLISKTQKHFVMTGSSARKLKKGGANLLAGRAFVYHLFPLTSIELGPLFNLDAALRWGTLPQVYHCENDTERQSFLQAYAYTYLKEEIWSEQFIRKLDPFRSFLEVAAQSNGKIINFNNMARDIGVDDKTGRAYYAILEDTLVGFFLSHFIIQYVNVCARNPNFIFLTRV